MKKPKFIIREEFPHVFSIKLPETKTEIPIGECFGGKGMAENNAKKIVQLLNKHWKFPKNL